MISARQALAAFALAVAAGGWTGPAMAQEEAAVVRRATDLREQPADNGRSLASLAADAPVTRLAERQGPWVRVRSQAGVLGWVHMFDLGTPGSSAAATASSAGSGLLRGVTSLFSKPSPTIVSTSTLGVRGLGAEDLAKAQPDAAAVTRAEALRVSDQEARQFAAEARLTATPVEPLPAPGAGGNATGAQ